MSAKELLSSGPNYTSTAEGSNVIPLSRSRHRRTNEIHDKRRTKYNILVVGADGTTYRIIEEIGRQVKASTHLVKTSDHALDELGSVDYDVAILVNNPPIVDALHVLQLFPFLLGRSKCKFLVLHDGKDWEATIKFYDVRIDAHLPTPFNPGKLKQAITSLLGVAK